MALEEVLNREGYAYYTQNIHYLYATYEKWLGHYKVIRKRRNAYSLVGGQASYNPPQASEMSPHTLQSELNALCNSEFELPTEYVIVTDLRVAAVASLRALPGYEITAEDDLPRLIPPDEFEEEMRLMAQVRAFFQVAYKVYIPLYHTPCDQPAVSNLIWLT